MHRRSPRQSETPEDTSTRRGFLGRAAATGLVLSGTAALARTAQVSAQSDGERGQVVIALDVDAVQLDPRHAADRTGGSVINLVYSFLVRLGDGNQPEPDLAERWEVEEDRIFTFYLNQAALFHDGTPVTAHDVEATYRAVLDPEFNSAFRAQLSALSDIRVVDDHTIQFEFPQPFGPALAYFALTGIASRAYAEANPDTITRVPMGSGPYTFDSWEPNAEVRLLANDGFYGGTPAFDRIIFRVIPDETVRTLELTAGSVDLIYEVSAQYVEQFEASGDATVIEADSGTWSFFGMRANRPPFDDIRVRRAVAHAIDRDEIIQGVWEGLAEPIFVPLEPTSWAYPSDPFIYEHDLERAAALLAEAGYPDGFQTAQMTRNDTARTNLNLVIQAQLARIGIDTQLESLDGAVGLERQRQGNFVTTGSFLSDRTDPDEILFESFHSSGRDLPDTRNYWYYANERVDALLEEGRSTVDIARRTEVYQEALRIIIEEDAALVPVAYTRLKIATKPNLEGGFFSEFNRFYRFAMNGKWVSS